MLLEKSFNEAVEEVRTTIMKEAGQGQLAEDNESEDGDENNTNQHIAYGDLDIVGQLDTKKKKDKSMTFDEMARQQRVTVDPKLGEGYERVDASSKEDSAGLVSAYVDIGSGTEEKESRPPSSRKERANEQRLEQKYAKHTMRNPVLAPEEPDDDSATQLSSTYAEL